MVRPKNVRQIEPGQCTAKFRKNPVGAFGSGYCRPQYGMDRDPQNPDKYVVGVATETNVMAYGAAGCQTKLTLGQEARAVCFAEMNWQHVMPSMAGQKVQTRVEGVKITSPQPPSPVFVTLSRGSNEDCLEGEAATVEWLPPVSDLRCREPITVQGAVVKGQCAGKYTVWEKRSGTTDWSVVKTVFVPDFGKTKISDAETTFQYTSAAFPVNSSYHFKIVASSWVDHSGGPTLYNLRKGYWNDGPAVEAFAPGNPNCGAPAYPEACPSCVTPASYSSALAQGPAYPGCGLKGQNPAKKPVLREVAELTRMYAKGGPAPPPATAEPEVTQSAKCADWCSTNSNAWSYKCIFVNMCDECPQCFGPCLHHGIHANLCIIPSITFARASAPCVPILQPIRPNSTRAKR